MFRGGFKPKLEEDYDAVVYVTCHGCMLDNDIFTIERSR